MSTLKVDTIDTPDGLGNITINRPLSGPKTPKGADISTSSGGNLTPGSDGNAFDVNGTDNITSIDSMGGDVELLLQFNDAVVVTHHATDLILPNATNITTVAGQILCFYEYATGDWRLVSNSVSGMANVVEDTTPQLGGDLDCQDNKVSKAELKDYAETLTEANTSTTYTIDLVNGNVFELTLTGNVTYTISNPPGNNIAGSFTLIQKQDATGGRTMTLPASVKHPGGTGPTISSAANAIDIFTFITTDNGTTWWMFTGGQDFS